MNKTTGKKRSGKKAAVNPLAAARPKVKSLDSVWHVKLGAGYQLFVEYYKTQPAGIVCDEHCKLSSGSFSNGDGRKESVAAASSCKRSGGPSKRDPTPPLARGLSRASKRRRKKKGEPDPIRKELVEETKSCNNEESPPSPPPSSASRVINARLLQEVDLTPAKISSAGFNAFVRTLTRPLPVTFRLRSHISSQARQRLLEKLAPYLTASAARSLQQESTSTNIEQGVVSVMRPTMTNTAKSGGDSEDHTRLTLLSIPGAQLLKQQQYARLAEILQLATTQGALARQEIGSLLPVLAVRTFVERQHQPQRIRRLLDMCSSPGSKTLQLVEWMMEREASNNESASGNKPVVVRANDVNPRRLEELKEAVDRSGVLRASVSKDGESDNGDDSPQSFNTAVKLKFTNQDASRYTDSKPTTRYDIILADVPCSGDGTVRKDARVLPYWTPRTALGLHELQVKILCRALKLLAFGGVAVYSTCSLNPIENEAVVAAAMRRMRRKTTRNELNAGASDASSDVASYRLLEVQVPDVIPLEMYRRGISTWRVADYVPETTKRSNGGDDSDEDSERARLTWLSTFEEAEKAGMEGLLESMWPAAQTDEEKLPLHNCLRLWPQDIDTGGFFVAMIQRVA